MNTKVTGYKGFDKDLRCRDMQFEVGKIYLEPTAELCRSGLHFCEHPLDCFGYYPPGLSSRYCLVEASGEIVGPDKDDTKRAATKLKIVREVTIAEMTAMAVKMAVIEERSLKNRGAATASGDSGAATASGYSGAATASGDHAISCALGINGRARGKLGTWIVVAERINGGAKHGHIKTVCTASVDGETIKADTWYTVRDGAFTEVSE